MINSMFLLCIMILLTLKRRQFWRNSPQTSRKLTFPSMVKFRTLDTIPSYSVLNLISFLKPNYPLITRLHLPSHPLCVTWIFPSRLGTFLYSLSWGKLLVESTKLIDSQNWYSQLIGCSPKTDPLAALLDFSCRWEEDRDRAARW